MNGATNSFARLKIGEPVGARGEAITRRVSVLPSERPGTVEHDFWRSVHTLGAVRTEERGRETLLSRARQKVDRVGVRRTLADWALKPEKTTGFGMLPETKPISQR